MEAVLIVLVLVLGLAFQVRGAARCREHIAAWAESNGYYLVEVRARWFTTKWLFRTSKAQRLYEVEVIDAANRRRVGIARVGGAFLGALTPQVDVSWYD